MNSPCRLSVGYLGMLSVSILSMNQRAATFTVWVAAFILLLPGLSRLSFRTDGLYLLPEYSEGRTTALHSDKVYIAIETDHSDGIYNSDTLTLVRKLTENLSAVETIGSNSVVSLASECRGVYRPEKTNAFPTFCDHEALLTDGPLAIKDDVRRLHSLHGTLVSCDRNAIGNEFATSIVVNVPRDHNRARNVETIMDCCEKLKTPGNLIHVVGAPVVETQLAQHIASDLCLLMPCAIFVMAACFYWFFRSLLVVMLPFLEIAACLLMTFGLMGYLQIPVTLTTLVLPVVMMPLVVADELHIFTSIQRAIPSRQWHETLCQVFGHSGLPILKTGITTAVACSSFVLSPIVPIQEFGIVTAIATMLSTAWTLTALPALLVTCGRVISSLSTNCGGASRKAGLGVRFLAAGMVAVILLSGCSWIPMLLIQDDWTGGFSPNSELRKSSERCDDLFSGTSELTVRFDTSSFALTGDCIRIDSS